MKPDFSDARNSTHLAISSGSPKRPVGICEIVASIAFSGMAMTISVAIYPGHMALAVIPVRAPSCASYFTIPKSPAFVAA